MVSALSDYVKKYGRTKAFVFADKNTYDACGENVCGVLEKAGIDKKLPMTFCATKDIRDKYVLSRLCFDLGILDEAIELILFP